MCNKSCQDYQIINYVREIKGACAPDFAKSGTNLYFAPPTFRSTATSLNSKIVYYI